MANQPVDKEAVVKAIRIDCQQLGLGLSEQIAYVLATVEHESNGTFAPVVESYWLKDPDAWCKKNHPEYYPYYGRGYVQLTWEKNYRKYSELTGHDLICHPELALEPDVARFVLVHGFKTGGFTGKKLEDYVDGKKCQFLNARRCINGIDKAGHIATLAEKWLARLREE